MKREQEHTATVTVTEQPLHYEAQPSTTALPEPAKREKAQSKKTSNATTRSVEKPAPATVSLRNATSKTDKKVSKYDTVASGKCPHCGGAIASHEKNTGVGERHTCGKCKHVWYLNRVIHTCKDLTLDAEKRKHDERTAKAEAQK